MTKLETTLISLSCPRLPDKMVKTYRFAIFVQIDDLA